MKELFLMTVIAATLSAYLLILAAKWKVVEWMQVRGWKWLSDLANCDFCLSWWINVAICIVAWLVMGDVLWLVVPFFATMLTGSVE